MSSRAEVESLFGLTLDGCSVRDLKKAYAKKIKIHSPEKDPEMFQVVRQSYETGLEILTSLASQHDEGPETGQKEVKFSEQPADLNLDGLLRCMKNGLPDQAISYINEMQRESYHIDLAKRADTVEAVITYLYSLEESDPWYPDVVARFIELFRLDNEENEPFLAFVTMQNWCHHYGWTRKEYELRSRLRQHSYQWWNKLLDTYQEEGEFEAIQQLKLFMHSAHDSKVELLEEWFDIFLANIDGLFPKSLPWDLISHIESILVSMIDISAQRFEHGLAHLEVRKSACKEVEKYRKAAQANLDTAYSLACRVVLGLNNLTPGFSKKKVHILKSLFEIRSEISSLSDAAMKYEVIDQGHWAEIEKIKDDIENKTIRDFFVDPEVLEKDLSTLKIVAKVVGLLGVVLSFGLITYFIGLSNGNASDNNLVGFLYAEVTMALFCLILYFYYNFKRLVFPRISYHKYRLYVSQAYRQKFYFKVIPLVVTIEALIFFLSEGSGPTIFNLLFLISLATFIGGFRALLLMFLSSVSVIVLNRVAGEAISVWDEKSFVGLSFVCWAIYVFANNMRVYFAKIFKSQLMPASISWVVASVVLSVVPLVILNLVK